MPTNVDPGFASGVSLHWGGTSRATAKRSRESEARDSNPHRADIDVTLLRRILRLAGIDESTWSSI